MRQRIYDAYLFIAIKAIKFHDESQLESVFSQKTHNEHEQIATLK
jgi:hypothetical protein